MFSAKPTNIAIISTAIILIVLGTSIAISACNFTRKKKPNVILFFTDQHNKKVTSFDGHPDVISLNLDKLANESLAGIITGTGSLNRDYVVSESWSQACVITKESKFGIMLDPTVVHPNLDYREFGDMFLDMKNDPLEVDNKIDDVKYEKEIAKLREYI